jgi:thioredoxin reductase
VCGRYPNGVTTDEYRAILRQQTGAARWGWRVMTRNPGVYARGDVRHSDHATITLPFWHRVLMNTETQSRTMANVAFLD